MKHQDKLYNVWWQDWEQGEQQMEEGHRRGWQEFVGLIVETDLSDFVVLDFGCNQGGFLRYLYQVRPFKKGMGVDLAQQSVAVANSRKGDLPLEYVATTTPEQFADKFDLVFSLAVIYLIKDLATHAWKIKQVLKPGGVYYATYTDHIDNPSQSSFLEWINKNSLVEATPHTLDFIAETFVAEGFQVEVRRRIPQGYIDLSCKEEGYHGLADRMQAMYEQSYVFRFTLSEK